ncbi:family 78 glycoside hydrolase catalytic domain [Kineococcus auxinigenes]|uniref:family 78 glycoside hydrolase catalytic domain n=1 Tax=unclassified Kineococcus TaxID=2621656 RepID=UPI003D7D90DF
MTAPTAPLEDRPVEHLVQDAGPLAPVHLTVDDLVRPLSAGPAPRFGWLPQHPGGDQVQTAYQLRLLDAVTGRLVADTGRVSSPEFQGVRCPVPDLPAEQAFTWTVRTWDRDGVVSPYAPEEGFDTAPTDRDWSGAQWVRRVPAPPATGSATTSLDAYDDYTLARAEVDVPASPVVRARVHVAASKQYELHLDGAVVARGHAFGYPSEGFFQSTDVTAHVRAGTRLAIGLVYHCWVGTCQGNPPGPDAHPSGFLLKLVADHADGSRTTVVSDGTWRVARAPQWCAPEVDDVPGSPRRYTERYRNDDAGDYWEEYDARAEPQGWDRPGYDGRGARWEEPVVVGEHPLPPPADGSPEFTRLHAQEARLERTAREAVSLTRLPDGSLVADLGQVVSAVPVLRFRRGVAGRRVRVLTGYALDAGGGVATDRTSTQGSRTWFDLVQRDGEQEVRPFTYWGFRYVQLPADAVVGEELTRADVRAVLQHTEAPHPATFSSSDPVLDEVFELMRHSALVCAQEQFLDTPTREKGQFTADAINISAATTAACGERALTRQAIREICASQARYWDEGEFRGRVNAVYPNGDGPRDIPDFTEMVPGWVWQHHVETGDLDLPGQVYPALVEIGEYVQRATDPATGLVTALPGGGSRGRENAVYRQGIVDWPAAVRYGYDWDGTLDGVRTPVNAWAVDAHASLARLARALGRPADEVARHEERAAALVRAVNSRLRRPDGAYVDGLAPDGTPCAHAGQISSSLPLAFGFVPEADVAAVADHVQSLGMNQGPMTAHRLLQGLAAAGRTDAVLRLLTDPDADGWANVLARGGTCCWEQWNPVEDQSLSHGWGAQAVVDVLEVLLGVRVAAPGAAVVEVRPPVCALRRAAGTRWTQRGPVGVRWSREEGAGTELEVRVPVGVSARVSVPADSRGARGEGRPRLLEEGAGRVTYLVGSGTSVFGRAAAGA